MKKTRLGIRKITLRELDAADLEQIAGGDAWNSTDMSKNGTTTYAPGCTWGADCASTLQGPPICN
jgi:hypothetical protein